MLIYMQIAVANLAFVWGKQIWKFISFLINSFFYKIQIFSISSK